MAGADDLSQVSKDLATEPTSVVSVQLLPIIFMFHPLNNLLCHILVSQDAWRTRKP